MDWSARYYHPGRAVLRFANLNAIGLANHYYTAAVTSMLQSWHNFFFVAAEPGGSVSVDKPPLGLWIQTVSAYFFGVSGFSVVLPEIIAGILSVIVLYHLVRRSFGNVAGLLAALALAITPIVIATDRNNTMDSILILDSAFGGMGFYQGHRNKQASLFVDGRGSGWNWLQYQNARSLFAFACFLCTLYFGFQRKVMEQVLEVGRCVHLVVGHFVFMGCCR